MFLQLYEVICRKQCRDYHLHALIQPQIRSSSHQSTYFVIRESDRRFSTLGFFHKSVSLGP